MGQRTASGQGKDASAPVLFRSPILQAVSIDGMQPHHSLSRTGRAGEDEQMLAELRMMELLDPAADFAVDFDLIIQHNRIFSSFQHVSQIAEADLSKNIGAAEKLLHHIGPGAGRKKVSQICCQLRLFALSIGLMPQGRIGLIAAPEKLILILKVMKELTALHVHFPVGHIAVIHAQVLGVGQRLLDGVEPVLKAVFCSGQADRDTARPSLSILFDGAPLLQFDDQHQWLSRFSALTQKHGVDPVSDGGLIFQNQRQLIQPGPMDHLHQKRNGVEPGAILTFGGISLQHLQLFCDPLAAHLTKCVYFCGITTVLTLHGIPPFRFMSDRLFRL